MTVQDRGRCVGIPWYTRATYADSVAAMEDRSLLPESYDRWLRAAERVAAHAYDQGLRPIRAYIDAAHFAEWCRDHGLRPDRAGRKAFARWVAEDDDRVLPTGFTVGRERPAQAPAVPGR